MCKMRVAVRREMLGAREQAWSLWNGKEVMEYTGNQIKSLIKSGQKVCGLALKENELVPDAEGFFTTNIMEHRYCGNFTPMIENENVMSNVFYIVIGSHEESGVTYYDCISTKFEQTAFNESDVRAYLRLGIISGGARLGADDKIELASLEYEKAEETKPTEKKGAVEKRNEVQGRPLGTVDALLVKRVSRGSRGIQRDFREVQGEMIEQYKGYEIKVYWSSIEKGYIFCVFSKDGEGILESVPYFYEENAWMGARETVDRYIEVKERGLTGGLSDIYNHPHNDNHFIMWNSLFR